MSGEPQRCLSHRRLQSQRPVVNKPYHRVWPAQIVHRPTTLLRLLRYIGMGKWFALLIIVVICTLLLLLSVAALS